MKKLKLTRDLTGFVQYILDEFLPPIIRDNRFFMSILLWLLFRKDYKYFLNFKSNVLKCKSQKELSKLYQSINTLCIKRDTDLNSRSLKAVIAAVKGPTVLEVGAGRCHLAKILAKNYEVTACDVSINFETNGNVKNLKVLEACIESLPFAPRSFATVVCTHTLEHVFDVANSIKILRCLAVEKFIIVIPKQRFYTYTFDTHLHFFPTVDSFLLVANPPGNYTTQVFGNDIVYMESLLS